MDDFYKYFKIIDIIYLPKILFLMKIIKMENIKIRCRSCGTELEGYSNRSVSCRCSNMTTITGNKISAVDLSKVLMLNSVSNNSKINYLSSQDLQFQEERKKRKVKKLDFEIR